MVGIPMVLATRQDWLQVFSYVETENTPELRSELLARLVALNETRYMNVLKDGVDKPPEEQTPEDYERVLDPASSFVRSGLSEDEIQEMIGALTCKDIL
jgi:hypothetical protein